MHPTGGSDVCTMERLLRRRTPELTGVKSERGFAKRNRGALAKGDESGARRRFLQALIVEVIAGDGECVGNRLRQFIRCDDKPIGRRDHAFH